MISGTTTQRSEVDTLIAQVDGISHEINRSMHRDCAHKTPKDRANDLALLLMYQHDKLRMLMRTRHGADLQRAVFALISEVEQLAFLLTGQKL